MFLKSLKIFNKLGEIRNIKFQQGLNLIVDDTPTDSEETGNNVGKTTLLRLIDYCMGMDAKAIYTSEAKTVVNEEVKKYLTDAEVEIVLTLVDSFDDDARQVVLRRNFLNYNKAIYEVNGLKVTKTEYENCVQKALWNIVTTKPSFRQIISHNFRHDDMRLSQTLRTLHGTPSNIEYETLHLYLFGCNFDDGERRQELDKKITTDKAYKRRLEKEASKSALRSTLSILEHDIEELNSQKELLHLNPDFEKDLDMLNAIKQELNGMGARKSSLQLRYSLIEEALSDLKAQNADIDMRQLSLIYQQASSVIGKLQHTFEDLVSYHNEMLKRKANFISAELPGLEKEIKQLTFTIQDLRVKEKTLSAKLKQSISYEALDSIIGQLNEKYQVKGNLEQRIKQIEEVEKTLADNEALLAEIDKGLFSSNKQEMIQAQLDKFNVYYSNISRRLYDESYAIKCEPQTYDGKTCYKFTPFATNNFGSGKKQGEITCFDVAYILFADEEGIPCLHFVLNDKKELMHDNQLIRIGNLVNETSNIQYVASILRDKLPEELNREDNIILSLSQHSRLFKIEEYYARLK